MFLIVTCDAPEAPRAGFVVPERALTSDLRLLVPSGGGAGAEVTLLPG